MSAISQLKGRLQTGHKAERQKLKENSNEQYDKRAEPSELNVGQQLLLYDETVHRSRSKELCPQHTGPYEALFVNGINATIKKGHTTQQVHINRLVIKYRIYNV
jgi:hypothetical protein